MTFNLQIVDVSEKDINWKYHIMLYCIDDNSDSYCIKVQNYNPFFYINYKKEYHITDLNQVIVNPRCRNDYYKTLKGNTTRISYCNYKKLDEYQEKKKKFIKLEFDSIRKYGMIKKAFEEKVNIHGEPVKFQRYESNINQFLRFFHIKNINLCKWIKINKSDAQLVPNVFSKCKFEYEVDFNDIHPSNINKIGPMKILSYDIECASDDGGFPQFSRPTDKIIQIGNTMEIYGKGSNVDVNFIICLKNCQPIDNCEVINCQTEKELIQKWCEKINEIDPDIITGYNIWGFDYQYIYERAKLLNLDIDILNISRIHDLAQTNFRDNEKIYIIKQLSSSAMGDNQLKYLNTTGRINIDLIKYVRDNKKLPSYKLDYVAEEFIGQNKNPVTPNQIFDWYREGKPEKITTIAKYCIQDCKLVNKLINKLSVIENSVGMSNTCWIPINYVFTRGQGIKAHSLVLKECSTLGYIMPHLNKLEGDIEFKGATVLTANSGIHYYPVSALDFASLYPSCMISHNLCISSFISQEKLNKYIEKYNWPIDKYRKVQWDETDDDGITTNKTYFYVQPDKDKNGKIIDSKRAVFPQILMKLLNKRNETKKLMKKEKDPFKKSIYDGLQLAYKITANSIYGQLGSPVGAMRKLEVAASVTTCGRQLLELAQNFTLQHYEGSVAIYGDSVTRDTPILLRNKDKKIRIKTIETLSNEWNSYEEFKPFDTNRTEKQQAICEYQVWSRNGWTNIKRVIRHKTTKKIYRILTHTGVVDVSEDHSLLNSKNEIIKPIDCKVGETLLLQSYPKMEGDPIHLNELVSKIYDETVELTLEQKEAFIYGIFYGDGSCGKYETKWGVKYSWAINNQDTRLLNKTQKYLIDLYNNRTTIWGNQYSNNCLKKKIETFKILETMKSSGVNKLVPKGSIKSMVDIFRPLFYDKDKYKIVPNKILNGNYNQRLYFLIGYYAADGDKCTNSKTKSIGFDNKGKIGTAHLYYLMKTLGYKCSLNIRMDKPKIYGVRSTLGKQRKIANKIKKIIELRTARENEFIYDIETEDGSFQAGIGNLIVKNTDSIFMRFNLKRHQKNCLYHKDNMIKRKKQYHDIKNKICEEMKINNEQFSHTRKATAMMFKTDFRLYNKCNCEKIPDLMSEEALKESIRLACEVDAIITDLLPDHKVFVDGKQVDGCQQLEYEKTYLPYILFTKKRYVGKLFEYKTNLENDWTLDYKGIALKRRDSAIIVKKFYKNCLFKIMEGSKKIALDCLEKDLNNLMNNDKIKMYPIEDFVLSKTLKSMSKYKMDKKILQSILILNKISQIKTILNKDIDSDSINKIIDNNPLRSKFNKKTCFETCNHTKFDGKTGKKILSFKMNCKKCNKDIDNTFGINQLLDYLNDTYNSKVVKKEDRNIYLLSKLKTYRFNKKISFDKNIIDVIDLLAEFYKNNNEKLLIRIKNVLKKIPNSKINNEIVFYNLRKVSQGHVILTQRMTLRDPGSAPQINDRIQYCFIKVKGDSKTMLQGDLIENPDYIVQNNIPLNYNYYIEKQIKNPLLQLFEHVDEYKAKKIFKNIQNLNKNKLAGQTNIMDFLIKNK